MIKKAQTNKCPNCFANARKQELSHEQKCVSKSAGFVHLIFNWSNESVLANFEIE